MIFVHTYHGKLQNVNNFQKMLAGYGRPKTRKKQKSRSLFIEVEIHERVLHFKIIFAGFNKLVPNYRHSYNEMDATKNRSLFEAFI